jgi:hypothetical protein
MILALEQSSSQVLTRTFAVSAFESSNETSSSQHFSVFEAGADIKELKELDFVNAYMGNYLQNLNNTIVSLRTPLICVVKGFAVSTLHHLHTGFLLM